MTPLWINDFDILYNRKFLFEIIPKTGYDFNWQKGAYSIINVFKICYM